MTLQQQADVILERMVTVVCDGWVEPRHPRVVMMEGDPKRISHGICEECSNALLRMSPSVVDPRD